MMSGYSESRWVSLFFITFLVIGHLFLMNLVLATVVNSYQVCSFFLFAFDLFLQQSRVEPKSDRQADRHTDRR